MLTCEEFKHTAFSNPAQILWVNLKKWTSESSCEGQYLSYGRTLSTACSQWPITGTTSALDKVVVSYLSATEKLRFPIAIQYNLLLKLCYQTQKLKSSSVWEFLGSERICESHQTSAVIQLNPKSNLLSHVTH